MILDIQSYNASYNSVNSFHLEDARQMTDRLQPSNAPNDGFVKYINIIL